MADQLVDVPMIADHPLVSEFPDEFVFVIETPTTWKLHFDGSYTNHGSRARILFIAPQGDSIPKSYRIAFLCMNNMDEYEALLTRLHMEIKWKIKDLQVYGDSQLVIYQVNDDYDTKYENLTLYKCMVDSFKLYLMKSLLRKF